MDVTPPATYDYAEVSAVGRLPEMLAEMAECGRLDSPSVQNAHRAPWQPMNGPVHAARRRTQKTPVTAALKTRPNPGSKPFWESNCSVGESIPDSDLSLEPVDLPCGQFELSCAGTKNPCWQNSDSPLRARILRVAIDR